MTTKTKENSKLYPKQDEKVMDVVSSSHNKIAPIVSHYLKNSKGMRTSGYKNISSQKRNKYGLSKKFNKCIQPFLEKYGGYHKRFLQDND